MNDTANRFSSEVGNGQRPNFKNGKGRNATHKRKRCRALEVSKSKEPKPIATNLVSIGKLLRDIRGLGHRITQVANATWEITSCEEGRNGCLLVGDAILQRELASSYASRRARLGRSKKASRRSRNGTRSMGRGEQSNDSDGRGKGSVRQMARSN